MKQSIKLFFAFIFFLTCLVSIVFAFPIILPETFNFTEQASNNYTISISNSDTGASANITNINITIPAGFTFTNNTNSSEAALGSTFSYLTNDSGFTTLIWNSSMGVIQNSTGTPNSALFSFNLSANTSSIGIFGLVVRVYNVSGIMSTFVSNITINDTTAPIISFASPTPSATAYLAATSIAINITATDNFNVSSIRIWFYNSTGLRNNTNFSASRGYVNYTGLSQGTYHFNITAVDNAGNVNVSSGTRTVILDTTAPSVELSESEDITSSIVIGEIRITETGSGVSGECQVSGSGDVTTGSGTTYQEFEDDVDCDTQEDYTVTCYDRAGNSGSDSISLESLACSDSDSSSGGGGAAVVQTWTITYANDTEELSELGSLEQKLSAKQRLRVLIDDEKHFIGVKSLTSNAAVIEIASTPQNATINVGQSRKFDVDGDEFYDIQITLVSIANSKAQIFILSVKEPVSPISTEEVQATTNETAANAIARTAEPEKKTGEVKEKSSQTWVWAASAIGIVFISICGFMLFKNRKEKF